MGRVAFVVMLAGVASQYSPGVMQTVIANRQAGLAWVSLPADLPLVDGYIAVADCAQVGQVWWIRRITVGVTSSPGDELRQERDVGREAGQWEKHLVVDCAAPDDGTLEWMEANDVVLEVSYETAERWGIVGRGTLVEVGIRMSGWLVR